jgi:hypothetical protein
MSDSLTRELDQFEMAIENIKKKVVGDTEYNNLINGYEDYLENSRELAELELKGAINNIIEDNVVLNSYNIYIFYSLINSVKIAHTKISNLEKRISTLEKMDSELDEDDYGDRISTLEIELRLLKLNMKGGKGKKKYTKRVTSNNLAK